MRSGMAGVLSRSWLNCSPSASVNSNTEASTGDRMLSRLI